VVRSTCKFIRRTNLLDGGTHKGQVMPEYIIVLGVLSFILIVGPDSPLESLFNAFSNYYTRFSYATSRP
jgi:hypothetical protein